MKFPDLSPHFQQIWRGMAIGGFDVFIDLQLTGRIIFQSQRLTLLNRDSSFAS